MPWTETTRPSYQREGLRYASDTRDEEWALIEPFMPVPNRRGRRRTTILRAVVDAIFYLAQAGCQWRMLPKEFPPYTTVQRYFYRWRDDGARKAINHVSLMAAVEAAGRGASPTAGVIDRQSVKTTEAGGPAIATCLPTRSDCWSRRSFMPATSRIVMVRHCSWRRSCSTDTTGRSPPSFGPATPPT